MAPAKKKTKLSKESPQSPPASPKATTSSATESKFVQLFVNERQKVAENVIQFPFKKSRARILNGQGNVKENSSGVLYWMFRDQRVQDNWAFLFAQKLALKNRVPLYACFCLLPKYLDANLRHYKFLVKGLQEVESECNRLDIGFHLLYGDGGTQVPNFVRHHNIGAVVSDLSPLRLPLQWVESLKKEIPSDVPVIQVDAHNIVPVWETSDKQEYSARTIRLKINRKLNEYLTEFPPVVKHPHVGQLKNVPENDWKNCWKKVKIDDLEEVKWATPGYAGGIGQLELFCMQRLKYYATNRNDPLDSPQSDLSPWFHFGQISPQRCILQVNKYKSKYKASVEAFCEEAIVRRELSDNFCFYNEQYDSIEGCPAWAQKTLNDHKKDKREYIYTLKQFENAETHDDLWNSAQIQLNTEGKMNGFLRMYWAKKILEWSPSPESALSTAIYLNDRFSLDGRDPNGYVGCVWSIGGVHDQGWAERRIFGKIRFMNYEGCKRKFDVKAFVARYGGRVH